MPHIYSPFYSLRLFAWSRLSLTDSVRLRDSGFSMSCLDQGCRCASLCHCQVSSPPRHLPRLPSASLHEALDGIFTSSPAFLDIPKHSVSCTGDSRCNRHLSISLAERSDPKRSRDLTKLHTFGDPRWAEQTRHRHHSVQFRISSLELRSFGWPLGFRVAYTPSSKGPDLPVLNLDLGKSETDRRDR